MKKCLNCLNSDDCPQYAVGVRCGCENIQDDNQPHEPAEPLIKVSRIKEIINELQTGEDIYPESIFVPPTKEQLKMVDNVLQEHLGFRIDKISAHCMKHARDIAIKDFRKAIEQETA